MMTTHATADPSRRVSRRVSRSAVAQSRVGETLIFALTAFPLTLAGRVRWPAEVRRRTVAMLCALPLTLVAFALGLLILFLTYSGYLYPLRPETLPHLAHPFTPVFGPGTWGGPTLIGAWFIHAMAALGIQVVALAAIRALRAGCRRITRS